MDGGLDIREVDPREPDESESPLLREGRPFLRIYFRCANSYQRVFRNKQGTAYAATCPKCGKSTRFAVGPGGTGQRFFEVSC